MVGNNSISKGLVRNTAKKKAEWKNGKDFLENIIVAHMEKIASGKSPRHSVAIYLGAEYLCTK